MSRQDAVYARQSVEKLDSLSISGQIALCKKTAGNEKLRVYQDRGYSGKNTDRPEFQRLMKDIKADRIGTLYVYRLDRFSRSVADFGQLWEILQEHKVEFVSVNESFDTKTPMGRAMLHIIMVFAQLERETTAERVRDNYYRRAALGQWPGGPAPYGYDNAREHGSTGAPMLIPNEKAAVVQRIYREYLEPDMSLGKLSRRLMAEGIPGISRETWDNVMLSRLLHNPTYVKANEEVRLHLLVEGAQVTSDAAAFDGIHGVLLVGKRNSNTRKYTSLQDQSASVLNSVGLIEPDAWLAVQNKLRQNTQVGNSGKGTHTWLSGLLKCGKCGYAIKVQPSKGSRYLLCSGRYNVTRCDASVHIDLTELEQTVQDELERLIESCPVEMPPTEPDKFELRLQEMDRRADRLLDAFAESEELDQSYLKRAMQRIEAERRAILQERERSQAQPSLPTKLVFHTLGFAEKKAVAAQFIERIDILDNCAEIRWKV